MSATHPVTPLPQPSIPPNASPEMKEFLQNRAILNAKMAELRAPRSKRRSNSQAFAQFQKQNADLLKRQSELAKLLGQQQSAHPMTAPPPLQIPPNASPQLKAFLTNAINSPRPHRLRESAPNR